ncbi:MAG: type VI secretion system ImpA family N-terminal domain-containing protein [Rhizobiales bacterium]|nr:type VI secretion system ImpA family N-terminal domain-containing protein [Hyphomicrobiales bacterium]
MILGLKKASEQIPSLLTPIKGKEPSGRYLQYEHYYDQLRNSRIEEDETLALGVWQRELKKADWGKVEELSTLRKRAFHERAPARIFSQQAAGLEG